MKPSKTSLIYHIIGGVVSIFGFILYLRSGKTEIALLGWIGLTFMWLLALENDVYAKSEDKAQ